MLKGEQWSVCRNPARQLSPLPARTLCIEVQLSETALTQGYCRPSRENCDLLQYGSQQAGFESESLDARGYYNPSLAV